MQRWILYLKGQIESDFFMLKISFPYQGKLDTVASSLPAVLLESSTPSDHNYPAIIRIYKNTIQEYQPQIKYSWSRITCTISANRTSKETEILKAIPLETLSMEVNLVEIIAVQMLTEIGLFYFSI